MCISTLELDKRVSEIRSLKILKEETENEIKSLERDVIDFMTEKNLTEYFGSDFKATYKLQQRATLNKELLQQTLGDLTDYEKITTFNALRIK